MKIIEIENDDSITKFNVNWKKVNVAPSNHKLQYLDLCRILYPSLDNLRKYRY